MVFWKRLFFVGLLALSLPMQGLASPRASAEPDQSHTRVCEGADHDAHAEAPVSCPGQCAHDGHCCPNAAPPLALPGCARGAAGTDWPGSPQPRCSGVAPRAPDKPPKA
jgi:hypothetical protein